MHLTHSAVTLSCPRTALPLPSVGLLIAYSIVARRVRCVVALRTYKFRCPCNARFRGRSHFQPIRNKKKRADTNHEPRTTNGRFVINI